MWWTRAYFSLTKFNTLHSLVKNCNHKGLGIYYSFKFIFGISGTLISVLIRIELYSSGNRIISPENQNFYNISITLHGFLMIFFLVTPGLFGGFGNYFVPIFQGSPEVVYPRVNNFSILMRLLSYLFLILSTISEFGGGTGWTFFHHYPLLLWLYHLQVQEILYLDYCISSCLTSLNFSTTILNLRSYYLTLKTIPVFPFTPKSDQPSKGKVSFDRIRKWFLFRSCAGDSAIIIGPRAADQCQNARASNLQSTLGFGCQS